MSLTEVIESIERESTKNCSEEKTEIPKSLAEFVERVSPVPLSPDQKVLLSEYEKAEKEEKTVRESSPHISGRRALIQIMDEWRNLKELQEYRCSCGRLLGKFSGCAEIKCPKCGKVNVIGVE